MNNKNEYAEVYDAEILGEKLTDLRKDLNYTQEQVCKKILDKYNVKITTKTLQSYENASDKLVPEIGARKLLALANLYNVSTDYLLSKEKPTSNYENIKASDLRLTASTISKIKKYVKKSNRRRYSLFPEIKNIEDEVTSINILNSIIANTNLVEKIEELVLTLLKKENEMKTSINYNTRELRKYEKEKENLKNKEYRLRKNESETMESKQELENVRKELIKKEHSIDFFKDKLDEIEQGKENLLKTKEFEIYIELDIIIKQIAKNAIRSLKYKK